MKKKTHKRKHVESDDEDNSSSERSDSDQEAEDENLIDFKKKILEGSFLPAMLLLKRKMISVEDLIDTN